MHKILLVEDSVDVRILLKREFKKNPVSAVWEIIEAGDGVEALNVINNENVRLVITGIMAPNMDGLELVKMIKARGKHRDLPIIVLSDAEKAETDLLELGTIDFYLKPIRDHKPLITKVKTHIDAYLQVINLKRTVSFSQLNHDLENIQETMRQRPGDFRFQWKESHLSLTGLKLPFPDCADCADDSIQCKVHGDFQIESPQDIIALTRALLKRVEHYMLAEKTRSDELEAIVSERTKRLEEEKERAQSAARKKSEFITSMSHELRSPLNSIIGFSERIPPRIERIDDSLYKLASYFDSLPVENGKKGVTEIIDNIRTKEITTVNEFCGYIRNSGSHLLDLINDILDLSKIEADKMTLFPEVIDFKANFESVTASFRNIMEEKNLQLSCDVEDVSPHIYADRIRFDQILFNLVGNAVKFSTPGGTVKISARELAGESAVEFCVTDQGEGIPDNFREYVFNRFERADHSEVKSGIGLGLAIAKKLVELMGGHIWFESVPGQGSSFYFTVPTDKLCKVA